MHSGWFEVKNDERAQYQNFDKHRFLESRPVDVSREGGGLKETSMGCFSLQNRFVSPPLTS